MAAYKYLILDPKCYSTSTSTSGNKVFSYQEEREEGKFGDRLLVKIRCLCATSELPTINSTTKQQKLHTRKVKRQ